MNLNRKWDQSGTAIAEIERQPDWSKVLVDIDSDFWMPPRMAHRRVIRTNLWREPLRTLLVDDNDASLALTSTILQRLGCSVAQATSGEEAWDMYNRAPYPLVVCDYVLPGMNGLDVCRKVKDRVALSVFLLITGIRTDLKHYDAAYRAGVDDFLFKPADYFVLKNKLEMSERKLRISMLCDEFHRPS